MRIVLVLSLVRIVVTIAHRVQRIFVTNIPILFGVQLSQNNSDPLCR